MAAQGTSFDGKKAYDHVHQLTVEIGARLTGTAGEHKAAAYIAKHFKSLGLKVRRQRFESVTYDNSECVFEIREGSRWRTIASEPVMLSKSTPPGGVEGEVYFTDTGRVDFLSPEVKDKIVLALSAPRGEGRPRGIVKGPKAIIQIAQNVSDYLRRTSLHGTNQKIFGSMPMAGIGYMDGLHIVQNSIRRARLTLRNSHKKSHTLNVIGELPGTDPEADIVVVCGHYDSHWKIPGASDNAAGTAVMMELARALAGKPSRRTLRFIAFGGEETGLHGSIHYANELAKADRRTRKATGFDKQLDRTELDRHALTFNIDVHGWVLGRFHATYTGPEDLGASIRLLASESGFPCSVENKPMSSDGTPLAAVGIPNVQFARGGGGFGHNPADDITKLAPSTLGLAGAFAETFLRRYVTDAPMMAFAREISDEQYKQIRDYFQRGSMTMPKLERDDKDK